MSKYERKFDSFAEIPKDKEEDMSILETLLRAPAGSNVQNQLARGSVGDVSSEPLPHLIHRASEPRNSICSDVGAEGGQNVVRSSENVQKQKPTSNKRDLSKTNDSSCNIRNKKMRNC
ncbi:hypothetical protein CDAR_126561 [Caerostris darwini]|uniref:Uncharacterized protein n=1 Tax=Caerostris darwini TaxID=1538125 RepID=A0AAV4PZV1_9ARAC|nr:hypothetical protein CDAR_126561 [Caerostris darwini]